MAREKQVKCPKCGGEELVARRPPQSMSDRAVVCGKCGNSFSVNEAAWKVLEPAMKRLEKELAKAKVIKIKL